MLHNDSLNLVTDLDCQFFVTEISSWLSGVCLGAVLTRVVLLCEAATVYHLRISATDGGGLVGQTTVRVSVRCQGDRLPMFLMNDYKANVYATSHHGSAVAKVNTH